MMSFLTLIPDEAVDKRLAGHSLRPAAFVNTRGKQRGKQSAADRAGARDCPLSGTEQTPAGLERYRIKSERGHGS